MTDDLEQDARVALLSHYTSQMQGYKVQLLTIVVGFFAYVELIGRLRPFYFGLLLPLGVGVLAALVFWSVARFLWFGKHVRDIIREPEQNRLNRLDEKIHKNWGEREVYKPDSLFGRIIKIGGNGSHLFFGATAIFLIVTLVLLVVGLLFTCAHCMWG